MTLDLEFVCALLSLSRSLLNEWFSWTFVCSLVGICYTTIYTSYLTKPGYEKLIESVEDFVANGSVDLP